MPFAFGLQSIRLKSQTPYMRRQLLCRQILLVQASGFGSLNRSIPPPLIAFKAQFLKVNL